MTVDLTTIDAKIRKLQKLREMLADEGVREVLADPDMMDVIREETGASNNGTRPGFADAQQELPAEDSLRRKVLDTARAWNGKFETKDIVEKLQASGWTFNARDPVIAVNTALRALEGKWIRIARKGTGRQPHIFEVIRGEGSK